MRQSSLFLALLPAFALITGCVTSITPQGQAVQTDSQTAIAAIPETYPDYADVLETYVDDQGLVDYAELQANRQQLDNFVASFATVDPTDYETWTESEQIAYWINAYNAITLQSIINQDPIRASIKDIFGVWRITTHAVLDQSKTLDDIEHNVLRTNYNEPRIHAALVCAALSCPQLRTEPFQGDVLDAQLEDQSQQFINSPQGLQIDRENNRVMLSAIFDWFGQDWIPTYGVEEGFAGNESQRAVLNFISNYVSPEDAAYLREGNYDIGYLNYDWALNIQQ